MDPQTVDSLYNILKGLEPVGGLSALIIALYALLRRPRQLEESVEEIKSNHLHDIPELVENSRRTVEALQRIEVKLSENLSIIRAKLEK